MKSYVAFIFVSLLLLASDAFSQEYTRRKTSLAVGSNERIGCKNAKKVAYGEFLEFKEFEEINGARVYGFWGEDEQTCECKMISKTQANHSRGIWHLGDYVCYYRWFTTYDLPDPTQKQLLPGENKRGEE